MEDVQWVLVPHPEWKRPTAAAIVCHCGKLLALQPGEYRVACSDCRLYVGLRTEDMLPCGCPASSWQNEVTSACLQDPMEIWDSPDGNYHCICCHGRGDHRKSEGGGSKDDPLGFMTKPELHYAVKCTVCNDGLQHGWGTATYCNPAFHPDRDRP